MCVRARACVRWRWGHQSPIVVELPNANSRNSLEFVELPG